MAVAPPPDPCISPPPADIKATKRRRDEHMPTAAGGGEEWDLVERAKSGDRDAFGRIFTLHHASVFRLARSRLPHALAEDAVAETFTRAWAALPRYRRTGAPFVAWLYGIGRHVVADMAGAGRRVESRPEVAQNPHDPWPGGDDRLALGGALAQLPEEQRQVIELKFLVGLSNDEVGLVLGKKPGAVNTQQWRALRALQRILGSR
jgi:RNA polymerase sigma-70 factor (ECF subfamily)